MPAFPSKSLLAAVGLDGPTVLTAMGQLYDALVGLLGTAGTQSAALAALGAPLNGTHTLAVAYTILPADRGQMLECSGTWTLGASAAATLGDGFCVGVSNTGAGTITFDPNSTETVDGSASITIGAGRSSILYCDGGKWVSIGKGAVLTVNGASPNSAGDVTVDLSGKAGANSNFDWPLMVSGSYSIFDAPSINLVANWGHGIYYVYWSVDGYWKPAFTVTGTGCPGPDTVNSGTYAIYKLRKLA